MSSSFSIGVTVAVGSSGTSTTPYVPSPFSSNTKPSARSASFVPFLALSVNVPPVIEPASFVASLQPILVVNVPFVTLSVTSCSLFVTNTEEPSTPRGANVPPLIVSSIPSE